MPQNTICYVYLADTKIPTSLSPLECSQAQDKMKIDSKRHYIKHQQASTDSDR